MQDLGFTLDIIGKLMISFTAIMVHHRVQKEHKIDAAVFTSMKNEKIIGVMGMAFMVAGYLVHILL